MKTKSWKSFLPLLTLFTASLLGCQGDDGLPRTVEASGVVTLDGQPIEGALISLFGEGASADYYATGISDSNGNFSLSMYQQKDGAIPGEYKVKVSKTIEVNLDKNPKAAKKLNQEESEHAGEAAGVHWVNDLPKKYANHMTSGFSVTVPEDGIDDIKLELTSD